MSSAAGGGSGTDADGHCDQQWRCILLYDRHDVIGAGGGWQCRRRAAAAADINSTNNRVGWRMEAGGHGECRT